MINSKFSNTHDIVNTAVNTFSDVQQGAESGMAQGAQMGMMAGPEGALIGGAIGAVGGGAMALLKDGIGILESAIDPGAGSSKPKLHIG